MVVALHPDAKKYEAYGVYPGGQDGNPGSKYYDNFLDQWAAGKLNKLLFLPTADATHPGLEGDLILEPSE
jgi:penicillin amidase